MNSNDLTALKTPESHLQTEFEIAARWQPIVEASGLYDARLQPGNVYMLAVAIMSDPVVKARTTLRVVNPKYPAMVDPDYIGALRSMTLKERAALTRRIRQRWQGAK